MPRGGWQSLVDRVSLGFGVNGERPRNDWARRQHRLEAVRAARPADCIAVGRARPAAARIARRHVTAAFREPGDLCRRRRQSPGHRLGRDGRSPARSLDAADVLRSHRRRQDPSAGRRLDRGPQIARPHDDDLPFGRAVHQPVSRSVARQRPAQLPPKVPRRRSARARRSAVFRGQAGDAGRVVAHDRHVLAGGSATCLRRRPFTRRPAGVGARADHAAHQRPGLPHRAARLRHAAGHPRADGQTDEAPPSRPTCNSSSPRD